MTHAPNSYALPERMKRAGVCPAPPKPQPLRYTPLCLLALGCVSLMLIAFLYTFEPAEPCPAWYRTCSNVLCIFCVFGYLMAFVLALAGVMAGWSRFNNALVLLLCFLSPPFCLLPATLARLLVGE